jgi:hypothetical protein
MSLEKTKNNTLYLPKEKKWINPKVAKLLTEEDIRNSIPTDKLNSKEVIERYGKLTKLSFQNPVSNTIWDYINILDSSIFTPAANSYNNSIKGTKGTKLKPSYCSYINGTTQHKEYWREEYKRILFGYEPIVDGEPCGIRIPGEFYFYLNYCMVNNLKSDGRDLLTFPDFLLMDYYYFKELEARENPVSTGLGIDYKSSMVVAKSRRKGFQQPLSALVYKQDGVDTLGNLKIGDKIWGTNSKLVSVTDIFPQGIEDVYEVELLDGRKIKCGYDHLWEVWTRANKGKRTRYIKKTSDLINDLYDSRNVRKHYIRPAEPVYYPEKELPIDPYILGLFIGDGNITKCCKLTTGDQQILDIVLDRLNKKYNNKYKITQSNGDGYNYRFVYQHNDSEHLKELKKEYNSNKYSSHVNPLYEEIKKLNLDCKTDYKRIPDIYLYSSYEQRMEVLQGLLDSDGSISKDGDIDFCTISYDLACDVANLIRSLGIHCTLHNKRLVNGCFRIYLHTTLDVFKLDRKLVRIRKDKKLTTYSAIKSITKLDYQEEQQCIEVDCEDHLYLTDGYTPTHNSFKAAAGALWVTAFSTKDKPKIIIASATGKDATLCFKKAMVMLDFLSVNTPFGRQDIGDPSNNGNWKHIPVSMTDVTGHYTFGTENTRTKERRGRLSEISTASLAQNTDTIAGEGIQRIFFEEAGKIGKLKQSWTFSRESLKVGSMWKGIAVMFGTGGEMQKEDGAKGDSGDFADIFNNPKAANIAAYDNIHEYQDNKNQCGWFVGDLWFNPILNGQEVVIDGARYGTIDTNGNPIFWAAELRLNEERLLMKRDGSKKDYEGFLTQRCKTPSEAFLISEGNLFPAGDLWARKSQIEMSKTGYNRFRTAGELVESNGKITFKPDLEGKLKPIDGYPIDADDKEGCLLRYEAPMSISGVIPESAYIISVDPIGQNTASGKSLTSIIVFKTPKYAHQFGEEKIVATYRGRSSLNPQGYVHELLIKLSKYYNAKITYENDRDGGIFQYFVRTGNIGRLLPKPIMTISKLMPNSKTLLREYGHSMATERHKRIGEDLVLEWLLKRHPKKRGLNELGEIEEHEGYRNLDLLEDKSIIEELIAYNRNGNFDMVMALMGGIIQFNEYFNEDVIRESESSNDISDFWYELYLNKYGDNKSKSDYANKKLSKLTNNQEIEYDNI